jgi:hypothetical protein
MRHTVPTILTASTVLLTAMVGMPSNAQSQTVIIIGNGSPQPYYPQPYAYASGYYPAYGYYQSYYNNYYRPYGYGYYRPYGYGYSYGYGYYRPYRHWGYRGW